MRSLVAAAIQMRADGDPARSLARAVDLCDAALRDGADLVVLPENYAGVGRPQARRGWAFATSDPCASPAVGAIAQISAAAPHAIVVAGGTPELAPDGRVFNTALAIGDGRVLARYRKLHLFDADVGGGVVHRESDGTAPGEAAVLVRTPAAAIGLSICYDVRFPELYRALVEAGAEVLLVPAAFTVPTGRAHWEILVRARAIESQCFVVAAAQHGEHGEGRASWGHSLVVDPWGRILASADDGDAIVRAELDPAALAQARTAVPSLRHRVPPQRLAVQTIDVS